MQNFFFLSKSLNLHVRISQVHFHKTKNYKILKLFFVLSDSFNTLISIQIFIMNVKEIKFRGRYGLFNTKNWLFVCVLWFWYFCFSIYCVDSWHLFVVNFKKLNWKTENLFLDSLDFVKIFIENWVKKSR